MKLCVKCKQTKEYSEFHKSKQQKDGYKTECKTCRNDKSRETYNPEKDAIRSKKYRENNREYDLARKKQYTIDNREKLKKKRVIKKEQISTRMKEYYNSKKALIRQKNTNYYNNNKVKCLARVQKRVKIRLKTDIQFKLIRNLRNRLWYALQGKTKSTTTLNLLGCSLNELKQYIEAKFLPGMTWENYGSSKSQNKTWHIDHIIPLNTFNLSNKEELYKANHYSNLQPMWAIDNIKKGHKTHLTTDIIAFFHTFNIPFNENVFIDKTKFDIKIGKFLFNFIDELNPSTKPTTYIKNTKLGELNGLQVFHIPKNIWNTRNKQIKTFISSKLKQNKTIYARKCEIKEVAFDFAKPFINKYHIQPYNNTTQKSIGLFFNDKLVALACFSLHHTKNQGIVLNRFVCKNNLTIVGGMSKISKYASNLYQKDIMSWADLRYSNGNGYLQSGWVCTKILAPNYYYYNPLSGKIISKIMRNKKNANTPDNLTETQHAQQDGLIKIWECGKMRLIYHFTNIK